MYRTSFLAVMILAAGLSPILHDFSRMAQEAAPPIAFPITPDPAQCTVEPRSADAIVALLGTPAVPQAPASATPAAESFSIDVPLGRPADADTEADIIATVYEVQACFNAGDPRSAFALVTDAYLQDFAARASLTPQDIAFLTAESAPTPEEARPVLLAVTDVTVLPNGKAGAFVVTDNPIIGPDTNYQIFVRQGDAWLVDEAIEFL